MMRIVMLLAALALAGATSAPRAKMKALYEENHRLAKEAADLQRRLAEIDSKIEQARKALMNHEYVYAENAPETAKTSSCLASQETGQ